MRRRTEREEVIRTFLWICAAAILAAGATLIERRVHDRHRTETQEAR